MIQEVVFREGMEGLTPARIMTLYRRAPLIRPVDDQERMWEMFENSSLVLTGWHGNHLVGIVRVLTDGVLMSYLCDLAVEPDVQGLGIGRKMLDEVLKRCRGTEVLVRDVHLSASLYKRFGFVRAESAWVRKAG